MAFTDLEKGRAYYAAYRAAHREAAKAYDAVYAATPVGREARKRARDRYLTTPAGRAAHKRAQKKYSASAKSRARYARYRTTAKGVFGVARSALNGRMRRHTTQLAQLEEQLGS